jgi:drug/metabolite transporter (DMT)-like permease
MADASASGGAGARNAQPPSLIIAPSK